MLSMISVARTSSQRTHYIFTQVKEQANVRPPPPPHLPRDMDLININGPIIRESRAISVSIGGHFY